MAKVKNVAFVTNSKEHNYVLKMARLILLGKLSASTGVSSINVVHDDWCGVFAGGRCDCDPDIVVGSNMVR